jgi:hypothetical protein
LQLLPKKPLVDLHGQDTPASAKPSSRDRPYIFGSEHVLSASFHNQL